MARGVDQTVLTGVAVVLFLLLAYFAIVLAVIINRKRSHRVNSGGTDQEETCTSLSLKNGPPDSNGDVTSPYPPSTLPPDVKAGNGGVTHRNVT
ncbi:hypothetical protein ACOMHN_062135 [Nucella lapillus]